MESFKQLMNEDNWFNKIGSFFKGQQPLQQQQQGPTKADWDRAPDATPKWNPGQSWNKNHLQRDLTSKDQSRMAPKTSFSQQDVRKFKEALRDFKGIVDRYISKLSKNPQWNIENLKAKYLAKPESQIGIALQWADTLLSQSAAEKANKMESVLIEAVKIKHTSFQAAMEIIKDYMIGVQGFQRELMGTLQNKPKSAASVNDYYQQNVANRLSNMNKMYVWLRQKIATLMQNQGISQ